MKRLLVIILNFLFVCFTFTACENSGGTGNKVPDSYISSYVEQKCYEEYEDFSRMSISTEHNYDSETHIDTVLVTLTENGYYGSRSRQLELRYQYNKSSDLWNLFSASKWPYVSDCVITLNESVIGNNDFQAGEYTNFDGTFHLNITSFTPTNITVDCSADGPCTYSRWDSESENIFMENSETYQFGYKYGEVYFITYLTTPDGWYAYDNITYVKKEYVEVEVYIDIDKGVDITVYDSIFHD